MELSIDHSNEIHITLKELMQRKSLRDQINFTIYQLAKSLNMPHSILLRLIHTDPTKRVNNPRIDTLARIVDFFKADGFDVTIDDLLSGFNNKKIDVQAQEIETCHIEKSISVYSFMNYNTTKIGTINIKLSEDTQSVFALLSDEDIKPIFKKGSIFIIDSEIKPEDDMLIAVKIDEYPKILIRRLHIEDKNISFVMSSKKIEPILVDENTRYEILGVVIQIHAKT